jgi:glutathione S-transferase
MALHRSSVVCELREVVLSNKPAEMLEASAKGTVPVLLTGAKVIDESIDVMRWALTQNEAVDHWQVALLDHPLIQRNDGYFKYWLDRYKYFDRFPEQPQAYYFEQAREFLRELESNLKRNTAGDCFLNSSRFSVLDAAIFPFVRQFAFVDKAEFDLLPFPKLLYWLDYCLDSPLFLEVMNKYPAWSIDQTEAVLFGPET